MSALYNSLYFLTDPLEIAQREVFSLNHSALRNTPASGLFFHISCKFAKKECRKLT